MVTVLRSRACYSSPPFHQVEVRHMHGHGNNGPFTSCLPGNLHHLVHIGLASVPLAVIQPLLIPHEGQGIKAHDAGQGAGHILGIGLGAAGRTEHLVMGIILMAVDYLASLRHSRQIAVQCHRSGISLLVHQLYISLWHGKLFQLRRADCLSLCLGIISHGRQLHISRIISIRHRIGIGCRSSRHHQCTSDCHTQKLLFVHKIKPLHAKNPLD